MNERFRRNQFKIGVVGCRSTRAMMRIQVGKSLGFDVVAVADPSMTRAERIAKKYGMRASYCSLGEMLEQQQLDLAIVASEPASQASDTIAALEHCHVLCEEPFGRTLQEARLMVDAAGRVEGRVLGAGCLAPVQYHWSQDFVRNGRLGSPELLTAELRSPASVLNPEGVVAQLAAPLLAAALPMLASPVFSVSAVGWRDEEYGSTRCAMDIAQRASLMVDCANGARGHFVVDWTRRGLKEKASIRCEGSEGVLWTPLRTILSSRKGARPTCVHADGTRTRGSSPASERAATVFQLSNLVRIARGSEERSLSAPGLAVDVHEVLDAAKRSSEQGPGLTHNP